MAAFLLSEWPGSVMRPAIQRSNSYGGYRYTPVDTSVAEDSEGERTEGSTERSTGSRPTTRRSVSDSGMASNEYNLAPFDDIVDDKQVPTDDDDNDDNDDDDDDDACFNNKISFLLGRT